MGALLNPKDDLYVIRPSRYFCGRYGEMKGCFLDEWDIVESKHDFVSSLEVTFRIGAIRNLIYDIFYALKSKTINGM
jgi:hypothetical protein